MTARTINRVTVLLAGIALVLGVAASRLQAETVKFCGGDNGCFCGWAECEAGQCSGSASSCQGFCSGGGCNGHYWTCATPAAPDDCYEWENYVVNLCQCHSWP